MKLHTALLTRADQDRLRRFISAHEARLAREAEALSHLSSRVESARIVDAHDVPKDLVTLHSQVRMRDADTGRSHVVTAALPVDHDIDGNGAFQRAFPVATLLGARVGNEIAWRHGAGQRRVAIEQVLFQPESRRVWNRARRAAPAHERTGMSASPHAPQKARAELWMQATSG